VSTGRVDARIVRRHDRDWQRDVGIGATAFWDGSATPGDRHATAPWPSQTRAVGCSRSERLGVRRGVAPRDRLRPRAELRTGVPSRGRARWPAQRPLNFRIWLSKARRGA
jgi:hypothetical protein